MTNEEIKLYYIPDKKHQHHIGLFNHEDTRNLMDLARADERAKISEEIDTLKADYESEIERLNHALESRKFISG